MIKNSILGSTGSIGTQTLEVVENLGDIRVAAITGNKNIALLEKQARKFHPELIAVMDAENAKALQSRLSDTKIRIVSGMDGLVDVFFFYPDRRKRRIRVDDYRFEDAARRRFFSEGV